MNKLLVCLLSATLIKSSLACTAVDIQAKDGTTVAGRTMEWAYPMNWELLYLPQATKFNLTAPSGSGHEPILVTAKYATFGIATALANDSILEGQNSAGLGISANFLPGFTQYQKVTKHDTKYLSVLDLSQFVLANFATVAEVKQELPKYKVWVPEAKNLPVMPTVHYMITDKSGNSLIIEFIAGEMKLFDKNVQVMTNSPNYDWHMINIRNYLNLSNIAVNQRQSHLLGNVTQFGQGGGSIGLPGDYTTPSRFVKTTFLKHFAAQPQNSQAAVEQVGHILNNVDIPVGVVAFQENGKPFSDYTQWIAIKDLTNNQLYFADYDHRLNYAAINLNQIFKTKTPIKLSIEQLNYPTSDVTSSLLK